MESVDVLVQVFDRGENKQAVVQVPMSAFIPGHMCWKPVAALAAAVELGISFTAVERAAKYGIRPEDKARLRELFGEKTDCSGQKAALAMTDTREEASA